MSSYNSQVQQTLSPYTNNSNNILQFDQLGISSTGTLWFNDLYNMRVLGVDSTTGTSVSVINLASVGGALAIGVGLGSPNVWIATPNATTGTATVGQYSPTGSLIGTAISAATDAVNLAGYFVMGVQPDPTNSFVYLGGCVIVTPGALNYLPGQGFEYETAPGNFYPCDIRKVAVASNTVQQIYSVNAVTRAYLGSNSSFFQSMAIAPAGATAWPAGTILAEDSFSGIVYLFYPNGTQLFNISGISSSPAFTPSSGVLALESGGTQIGQYQGMGVRNVYNITSVTFSNPFFVGLGPSGSPVYVASENYGPVAVMNSQAQITGYIGAGTLVGPWAMTTDASGNLYVCDGATNIPYKFSSSGQLLVTFNSGTLNPYLGSGICVDPNNGIVHAATHICPQPFVIAAHLADPSLSVCSAAARSTSLRITPRARPAQVT